MVCHTFASRLGLWILSKTRHQRCSPVCWRSYASRSSLQTPQSITKNTKVPPASIARVTLSVSPLHKGSPEKKTYEKALDSQRGENGEGEPDNEMEVFCAIKSNQPQDRLKCGPPTIIGGNPTIDRDTVLIDNLSRMLVLRCLC